MRRHAWMAAAVVCLGAGGQSAVERGEDLFVRTWTAGDAEAHDDGLGPMFNADSCVACHRQGGPGGGGSHEHNVQLVFHQGRVQLLHRESTQPDWSRTRAQTVLDAELSLMGTPAGQLVGAESLLERNTPALFGAGRIDAIPAGALVEAAQKQRGRGVTGRVSKLADGRLGRFGWKGDVASLEGFVAQACANELGLTTPSEAGGPADLAKADVQALTAFVASLPSPDEPRRHKGKSTFEAVGCEACHLPSLGGVDGLYSDLLLHDMGSQLGERITAWYYGRERSRFAPATAALATGDEWRTPPLWGVADSGPWLHDGRADTLREAIELHGGEAEPAVDAWNLLPREEQRALLDFLGTLRAPDL